MNNGFINTGEYCSLILSIKKDKMEKVNIKSLLKI